jgi:hypothetical protein
LKIQNATPETVNQSPDNTVANDRQYSGQKTDNTVANNSQYSGQRHTIQWPTTDNTVAKRQTIQWPKDRQYSGQRKTPNGQWTDYKTFPQKNKDRASLKTKSGISCSARLSSTHTTCGTHPVAYVKDMFVLQHGYYFRSMPSNNILNENIQSETFNKI